MQRIPGVREEEVIDPENPCSLCALDDAEEIMLSKQQKEEIFAEVGCGGSCIPLESEIVEIS